MKKNEELKTSENENIHETVSEEVKGNAAEQAAPEG